LLSVTRADVRRYLTERGLGFAIDRSNADLGRTRNRVRRLLVPFLEAEFNPRLGGALAGLATRLRDEDDLLAAYARARTAALVEGERVRTAVGAEPPAIARRVVRAWLERPPGRGITATLVERVLALAAGRVDGAVALPGPARVVREGDHLVRRPGRQARPASFRLPIAPGETVAHPEGRWLL